MFHYGVCFDCDSRLERAVHYQVLLLWLSDRGWRSLGRGNEQQLPQSVFHLRGKCKAYTILELMMFSSELFTFSGVQEESGRPNFPGQRWQADLQEPRWSLIGSWTDRTFLIHAATHRR